MFIKKNQYISIFVLALAILFWVNAASAQQVRPENQGVQTGIASYYSNSFNGQLTSNGEVFSNTRLTGASNTLPLGTYVKVTNIRNRKWVVVKINDRMNKANKRAIDLTRFAAKKLGMLHHGIAKVKVEAIPPEFYEFYHISPDELVVFDEKGGSNKIGS